MLDTIFFNKYNEIISTIITLIVFIVIKYVINSITNRYSQKNNISEARVNLVKRYIGYLVYSVMAVVLVSIWGVNRDQIFVVISSILTVIGVAFFAQWSILSNITAGIIVFFSFPFKIGNKIRIMDKDYPIEAEIMDIKSFYTLLRTDEGEDISLPNNLLLQKSIVIVTHHKISTKTKDPEMYI